MTSLGGMVEVPIPAGQVQNRHLQAEAVPREYMRPLMRRGGRPVKIAAFVASSACCTHRRSDWPQRQYRSLMWAAPAPVCTLRCAAQCSALALAPPRVEGKI